MNSTILSFLVALGLPGTSACNAQQGGLPRVGETPPAAEAPARVQTETTTVTDDDEDDDVDVAEDMDDDAMQALEDEADLREAEVEADEALSQELSLQSLFEDQHERVLSLAEGSGLARVAPQCEKRCDSTTPSCGQGSCGTRVQVSGPLGASHSIAVGPGGSIALNGKPLKLRAAGPGSTIEFDTQDGQHIIVRSENRSGAKFEDHLLQPGSFQLGSLPTLQDAFAAKAQAQKSSEERVRELEARVRELEAKLAEREAHGSAPQARAFSYSVPQGTWSGQDVRAWSRAYADSARKAGEEARRVGEQARKQAEVYRKQALEQAERARAAARDAQRQWRVQGRGGSFGGGAGALGGVAGVDVFGAPSPFPAQASAPCAPAAPAAPDIAEPGMPGASSPAELPEVSSSVAPTTPAPMAAPGHGRAEELRAMMEEMRAQMQEMRKQMQALREELEQAPRRADALPR